MNRYDIFADRHVRKIVGFSMDLGRIMQTHVANPDCETDHGERSNRKLKDQPFYQRARNGKMKQY